MLGFFILMLVEEIFGEDPCDEDSYLDHYENLLNDILEEAEKKDLSYSDIKDIISGVK